VLAEGGHDGIRVALAGVPNLAVKRFAISESLAHIDQRRCNVCPGYCLWVSGHRVTGEAVSFPEIVREAAPFVDTRICRRCIDAYQQQRALE
jgi:hypothetical protein